MKYACWGYKSHVNQPHLKIWFFFIDYFDWHDPKRMWYGIRGYGTNSNRYLEYDELVNGAKGSIRNDSNGQLISRSIRW